MKILVDVIMVAVLVLTGWDVVSLMLDSLVLDFSTSWDFMEIEITSDQPPAAVAFLALLLSIFTWLCILVAFWQLHQVYRAKELSFRFVGEKLKLSAFASFGFWLGSTVIFCALPSMIVWLWSATPLTEGIFIPLGFETPFLILSLIFVTVGRTLERAEVIEDEFNQFV